MDSESKKNSGVDELLARAKNLQESISKSKNSGQTERDSDESESTLESLKSIGDNLSYFRRLIYNAKEIVVGVKTHFFDPLWRVLGPPVRFLVRQYKKIWNRYAFVTDKDSGHRFISRTRSSLLVGMTLLAIAPLTPTTIGESVRFVTTEPIADSFLILISYRTETFYLSHSEEIDSDSNTYSVRGCRSQGLCGEQDAAYFRVRARLAHDFWKLIYHGNPIYVPDHVVAPIAPGVNKCEVTYYGYRMTTSWLARLLRSMQLYPTMLEASCIYIGTPSTSPTP